MVLCFVVVVVVGYRCMMVLMRRWAVMVLRMIVPEILVHMERRPRGRRDDKGLHKRACDEATHSAQSTMTEPREKVAKLLDDAISLDHQ